MMTKHAVHSIHNVAPVGHGASGKTSLADAILFRAGAVPRRGSVDDGTSFADADDEEHRRHFSIDAHVLHAEHSGQMINLIDTPGYPDFIGAALGALNAVENAVVVINAAHGIEVNTRRMFHEAGERGLARMIVLNKLDAENVNFEQVLSAVRATFGNKCVLLNAPDGLGPKFTGVVSVLNPPSPVPDDCPVDLGQARTQLVEAIVECDEGLMERYLGEGDLSNDELNAALPKANSGGCLVPILCTAAKKDLGVPELLDALSRYSLDPTQILHRGVNGQSDATPIAPKEDGEFVGQVFKTVNDKFVGHLSYVRVLSGKLKDHATIYDLRTGKSYHLGA